MRRIPVYFVGALAVLAGLAGGCSTAPRSASAQQTLKENAQTTLNRFQRERPQLVQDMQQAAGYAVFPSIGKGGLGVGGAYGRGVLYVRGEPVGFADMTQATVGFQAGGQSYAELILFQDDAALQRFKSNTAQLSADASAVAVTAGAQGRARFNNGMAVYTLTNGGLMYEASVGGQRFTFSGFSGGMGEAAPNQPQPAGATTPPANYNNPPANNPPANNPPNYGNPPANNPPSNYNNPPANNPPSNYNTNPPANNPPANAPPPPPAHNPYDDPQQPGQHQQ